MLKDKNGKWVETLEITEDLWKKMMQETLNGVFKLLDSAEKHLDNGGNEAICAGLYTYAVEEYGKILLLQQYKPSSGKVKIKYKNGFRNHVAKFSMAINNLPDECITLRQGVFVSGIFDPKIFDAGQIADCEARLAIFYSDFTDTDDNIKPVPSVDKNRLKKAINQLRTIALGITFP